VIGIIRLSDRHAPNFAFKLKKIEQKLYTKSAKELAHQRSQYLDEFFKQLIAEINGER